MWNFNNLGISFNLLVIPPVITSSRPPSLQPSLKWSKHICTWLLRSMLSGNITIQAVYTYIAWSTKYISWILCDACYVQFWIFVFVLNINGKQSTEKLYLNLFYNVHSRWNLGIHFKVNSEFVSSTLTLIFIITVKPIAGFK